MSEFRGLHNPERHTDPNESALGITYCTTCSHVPLDEVCTEDDPCSCCWQDEVAERAIAEVTAEVEALRAKVQAVREACADHPGACLCGKCWVPVDARGILDILDGGDA